jgi:SAM-dependent methyltransferase
VQKVTDHAWRSDAEKIYSAYSIYHQGQGSEQAVFEDSSGEACSRSVRLLERLTTNLQLPERGRLLDIGCGNGALLRTFSQNLPRWSMAGTELSDKYRSIVESIERVEALYVCAPEQVPNTFNLITMVHLLEHILSPADFLSKISDRLEADGLLVIEVPNFLQNPFDLLIADHCTHFTSETITGLIQAAGFETVLIATDWVPKEMTIVARKGGEGTKLTPKATPSVTLNSVVQSLEWLESVIELADRIPLGTKVGIFGTSIAATWLFSELGQRVSFFVDEDPSRAGRTYSDRPIYHPDEVPLETHVVMALPAKIAESVASRIARDGVTIHVPRSLIGIV